MSQPIDPAQEARAANVQRMNVLAQLAFAAEANAARVREQARLIEAHARDLLGRINQASAINYSDPARATALLLKAERQFNDATAAPASAASPLRTSKTTKQPKPE